MENRVKLVTLDSLDLSDHLDLQATLELPDLRVTWEILDSKVVLASPALEVCSRVSAI